MRNVLRQTERDRNLHIKEENLERNNLVDDFGDEPTGQKFGEDTYVACNN